MQLVTVLLGNTSVLLPQPVPLEEELQERNVLPWAELPVCLCAAEKCVGSSSSGKVGRGQGINFWKVFCLLDALSPSHSVSTCSRTTCPQLEPLQPQTRALGLPGAPGSALAGRLGSCGGHGWPPRSESPQPLGWVRKKHEWGMQRLDYPHTAFT